MKLITIPKNARIRIKGKHYIVSNTKPKVGNIVLDRNDGTHGVCEMIRKNKIAIRDGFVSELNVDINSVYKPTLHKKHAFVKRLQFN